MNFFIYNTSTMGAGKIYWLVAKSAYHFDM